MTTLAIIILGLVAALLLIATMVPGYSQTTKKAMRDEAVPSGQATLALLRTAIFCCSIALAVTVIV